MAVRLTARKGGVSSMKTQFLASLVLLGSCVSSFATPFVYSFSGHVYKIFYDGAGIVAEQGVSTGDPVAF